MIFDPREEYGGVICFTLREFLDYMKTDPETFVAVCRFNSNEEYEGAVRALWVIQSGREARGIALVLEECEVFLSTYERFDSPYRDVINRGRHGGISIIGIGQRPSGISTKLRAQCTSVFTFVQNMPEDVAYLQAWGFDKAEVLNLPQFEFATQGESFESLTAFAPGEVS